MKRQLHVIGLASPPPEWCEWHVIEQQLCNRPICHYCHLKFGCLVSGSDVSLPAGTVASGSNAGSPQPVAQGTAEPAHGVSTGVDASRAGVRDTGRREGAAGNTAGAGSPHVLNHVAPDTVRRERRL